MRGIPVDRPFRRAKPRAASRMIGASYAEKKLSTSVLKSENYGKSKLLCEKIIHPPGEFRRQGRYQKMRRDQGYNISKIQPGRFNFGYGSDPDTARLSPKKRPCFLRLAFFPMEKV